MNRKLYVTTVAGMLLLFLGFILSIQIGAKNISLEEILSAFFSNTDSLTSQLIRDVRLPRVLASILTGGLLAIGGAYMQGIMKNPIAEPSILGVTQGATMFIALSSLIPALASIGSQFLIAILGSFFAGILLFLFLLKKGIRQDISLLLLAGTAMSMFFLSVASISALLQNRSFELAFWIAGGFRQIEWIHVIWLGVMSLVSLFLSIRLAANINVLSLGDETAIGLGIQPTSIRRSVLFLLIPICGICVASAGNIGFVGLFIPHILRKLIGNDYRKLLPISFLYGAILLLYADILARSISAPYELPIGIFTAILGIPIFLLQIRKETP